MYKTRSYCLIVDLLSFLFSIVTDGDKAIRETTYR